MTTIQAALAVISSVVLPFIIQAIKSEAMGGNAARWLAIAVRAPNSADAAIANGIPTDPGAWATAIFACVGGVQVAYAAFKAVGVTDKWLDALLAMGTPKKDD